MSSMRKATRKERLNQLMSWFNELDQHLFAGYFEDKDVSVVILDRTSDDFNDPVEGYASIDDDEIGISEHCYDTCTPFGIREVLLHEMIHLFVAYTYPNGKRVCGDGCRDFRNCEKNLQRLRVKQIERKHKNK